MDSAGSRKRRIVGPIGSSAIRERPSTAMIGGVLVAILGLATAHAFVPPARDRGVAVQPDFDMRLPSPPQRAGFHLREPSLAQLAAAHLLRLDHPGLQLRWDGMSGSPRRVAAAPGETLSPPTAGEPGTVARAFLRRHASLVGESPAGLRLTGVVPGRAGGTHVHFEQRIAGMEVIGGRAQVHLRADGAVTAFGTTLFSGIDAVDPSTIDAGIPAVEAVRIAVRGVYPHLLLDGAVLEVENGGERRTVFDGRGFGRDPRARVVLFPTAEGARPAWEVRVAEPTLYTDYEILIDVLDGRLLRRINRTRYATASIVDGVAPEPHTSEVAPFNYRGVNIENPDWIDGNGALQGNNASGHTLYYTTPAIYDPGNAFEFEFNTVRSAAVNAWYWSNVAHDRFHQAGFDEAAGNFQRDNFGKGGVEGDALDVTMFANGDRNNAYFTASTDGNRSTVNYLWTDCPGCAEHDGYPENGGERSSGYGVDVVYHEYAHGVTIRMVGGPADDSCLWGLQSAAMGEGWSDVFAASFNDDPTIGDYFFDGPGWLRDLRHDLTYDELCAIADIGCQYHADGMIWAGALWDLRASMLALGRSAAQFEELVVEGLKHTPCGPSYVDARDGILAADTALTGSARHGLIWNVFAARGIGEFASSTGENDAAPVTDFSVPIPHQCTPVPTPDSLSASPLAPNEIELSYNAPGASAVQVWRREPAHPGSSFSWIDSTTDPEGYIDPTVQGGRSYEYRLVALGTGGVACKSTPSATAIATATGPCTAPPDFDPNLTISDADDCTLALSWDSAAAGCAGDPVVYNVYGGGLPGYEPSRRLLLERTTANSTTVRLPKTPRAPVFLVTAETGTPKDAARHTRARGAQWLDWEAHAVGRGRVLDRSWSFDAGPDGWTADNTADPTGAWTVGAPTGNGYAGADFAPFACAGESAGCWVTGNAPSAPISAADSDGRNAISSPTWDGANGATLLTFRYWNHTKGNFSDGLELRVDNGVDPTVSIFDITAHTTQSVPAGADGWQTHEVELAEHITPSTAMRVHFVAVNGGLLNEFGIDDVRVYRRTACTAQPLLFVDGIEVDDTPPGWGNGNGLPEPGETVRLTVTLRNDGAASALDPAGRLTGAPAGVLIHEPGDSFPTIPPASSAPSLGQGFTITLPDGLDCGGALTFDFSFETADGFVASSAIPLETGSPVTDVLIDEDFEIEPENWQPEGKPGLGQWQWGDPIGTVVDGNLANPEHCAGGTGCYVTENGMSADPNDFDVDGTGPFLYGPPVNLISYKRSRMSLDLWFYDNSSGGDFFEDYGRYGAFVDDPIIRNFIEAWQGGPTTWTPVSLETTPYLPNVENVRLYFQAFDRDATVSPGYADHVVEMGVDNVRFEADRFVCAAPSTELPPNGVGDSVRVDRVATDRVEVRWAAPPVDATHAAAAYYELYRSTLAPSGFTVAETATELSVEHEAPESLVFLAVVAVNSSGSSGDEPAP